MKNIILFVLGVILCVVAFVGGWISGSDYQRIIHHKYFVYENHRESIFRTGDSISYSKFISELRTYNDFPSVYGVSWSLIMASRNNTLACRQIYDCLITWNSSNRADIDSIDETSREIALHYLDKASRLGDKSSEMLIDSLRRSRPEYFRPENNKIFTKTVMRQ